MNLLRAISSLDKRNKIHALFSMITTLVVILTFVFISSVWSFGQSQREIVRASIMQAGMVDSWYQTALEIERVWSKEYKGEQSETVFRGLILKAVAAETESRHWIPTDVGTRTLLNSLVANRESIQVVASGIRAAHLLGDGVMVEYIISTELFPKLEQYRETLSTLRAIKLTEAEQVVNQAVVQLNIAVITIVLVVCLLGIIFSSKIYAYIGEPHRRAEDPKNRRDWENEQ
jgi:hypothetical protein